MKFQVNRGDLFYLLYSSVFLLFTLDIILSIYAKLNRQCSNKQRFIGKISNILIEKFYFYVCVEKNKSFIFQLLFISFQNILFN